MRTPIRATAAERGLMKERVEQALQAVGLKNGDERQEPARFK